MDSLTAEDLKELEYDLNSCSVREFCDVFSLDASSARHLQEYRSEILFIFKFDQLLKLKGISKDLLQQWQSAKPSQETDKEFQKLLNIQTDSLSKLLESVCSKTGSSACLIAARKGTLLWKYPQEAVSLENAALQVPEWMKPVYDNLLQMKQDYADMQVLGFESGDLIFLPTSGFYLVALQPPGKLDQGTLSLWRMLASEIRRRYPPKIGIENHATVTSNDIAFDCPQCHLRIVVDLSGAGCEIPCPRCKTQVTVPAETTSFSSYRTPEQGGTATA